MAADSLVLCEVFELLGGQGGVQSDIPLLKNSAGTGARFQLLAPDTGGSAAGFSGTWSLGEPQPTIDIVQSLLLDGERPFGARASNRTITLQVKVTAPDQVTLAAATELLIAAVDAPTFTLVWTPSSTGLPMVFDCFRALPSVYGYGFLPNQPQPMAVITLTFQALPYGRSDPTSLQQVAFASPLVGGVAAPNNPVVIDNFSTVSGTNWSQNNGAGKFVVGPNSAHYSPPGTIYPAYTKSSLSLNITGLPVLSVWLGQAWATSLWPVYPPFKSNVTLNWTLVDNAGHSLKFHRTVNAVPWSSSGLAPKWTRISATIPQGSATFNYTAVTSYTVQLSNQVSSGHLSWARLHVWLDAITANPASIAAAASQRGTVYNVMGAAGTARTPVSTQFQLPQSGQVSQELAGTGSWWPPVGVTSVLAECIGGGGSGGPRTTSGQGGGGGGGEFAADFLNVTAGTPVPFSVGTGGQSGDIQRTVTFSTPGTGNWLCPAGVTTVKAECWGGGATGGLGAGGGGGGEYAAEASLAVTAGNRYAFVVGAGGGPGGISIQHHGGASTFAGNSVTVTANGGAYSRTGTTPGGVGGTGSANTTHFNGGAGGTSPSYAGGGGGSSGYSGGAGTAGSAGTATVGGAGGVGPGGDGGAGANKPGFPVVGAAPGGGGGGGYSTSGNFFGASGGNGQVLLTYTVAAGAPVNGSSTTFGSAASTGTIVTAHGGSAVALNTTTGGAGGTGSANVTHFNGGAGGLGGTNGGGGGGSGGLSAGNAGTSGASGGAGAVAVGNGGKGANGSTSAGTAGDGASPPGGGGGGANSSGTTVAGGGGGAGNILLTWTPPLAPFNTLIAHRPGPQSPPELNPIVPIINTADPPAGTEYAVPSLTPGVNALFNGTYTVVLVNYFWDNPTVTRLITVTVTQYEYGGMPGSQQTLSYPLSVSRQITPSTDIVNGICIMGELTLPVKEVDPSNTSGYFTVSITDTDTSDQFLDVVFLDTQGSTVLINLPNNTYTNYFIDEPTPSRDLGLILGSDLDRSQALSVMDFSIVSGSPFYIVPGDNLFLAYTVNGAPNLGMSYSNRWYLQRLV
jgi:hypothetical protein